MLKMRKIIAVGGRPGTGKTSLFREFIDSYEWNKCEPKKMLNALYCEEIDTYTVSYTHLTLPTID
jgi:broad-specificity NMP kinase